jgi:hypothetical protein
MAKRKKARKSVKRASKKSATAAKHMVAHPSYHAKKFDCYGKMVRTKKGGAKNSARVYCGKKA